ncbi:TOXD protein [Lipomyces tetrasporus]
MDFSDQFYRPGPSLHYGNAEAVLITAPKKAEMVSDRPIPAPRDDYILVKTVSVLNSTDWKHIEYLAPPGVLVGCDYAGDRVCGFVHGSNEVQPEDGAFAEHSDRVPDNVSIQEAATLGLGVTTAGQGLYQSLKLALPNNPIKDPFAKLSGYKVYTTYSPRNFDLVKRLGADEVFDYNDPSSATAIRDYTNNGLKLVFDTISLASSASYCDRAEGGDYRALLPVKIDRENVNDRATMAYTAIGEDFKFGDRAIPAKPEDKSFSENLWLIVEKLLVEGKIKAHPPRVCAGGLKVVLERLQLMKEGKV